MINNKRLTILDGFRVIAIVVVLLFYYYYSFQNKKYDYDFGFNYLFQFGKLGVQFFFIISGFVITLTLAKCTTYLEFLKKRFLRLIPAMLICSILTFFIFRMFDTDFLFPESHSILNLVFSNTFISPYLINTLFKINLDYIDGAYWSLWVEICFYFIIGLVYFYNKSQLLRNYTIVSIILTISYFIFITRTCREIMIPYFGDEFYTTFNTVIKIFDIFSFSNWFLLGIILFKMHQDKSQKYFLFFTGIFIFQTLLLKKEISIMMFMAFIYILLMLFIYKPEKISFLGSPFISKLGVVSYSVYLIHQHIGILIINKFSDFFGSYNWIIGILLIVFFFMFGLFSYNKLEKPIGKKLKQLIFS